MLRLRKGLQWDVIMRTRECREEGSIHYNMDEGESMMRRCNVATEKGTTMREHHTS
jgi:hypothetical protein